MGKDYWAYNIEDSAPMIEAMMKFAYRLGITPKNLDYKFLTNQTEKGGLR